MDSRAGNYLRALIELSLVFLGFRHTTVVILDGVPVKTRPTVYTTHRRGPADLKGDGTLALTKESIILFFALPVDDGALLVS